MSYITRDRLSAVDIQNATRSRKLSEDILTGVIGYLIRNQDNQNNFWKNMFNFEVSIVSADGLAPQCARTSTGTVVTIV